MGRVTITMAFKTKKKNIKMNVIECYEPTNKSDETKDQFYNRLQTILDQCHEKDINILMGDFNAKIGADNIGDENIIGTQSLEEINKNGERFVDICALNKFIIGGSIFLHWRIQKAIWRSPDCVTENQIDHMCIGKKFSRSMQDVRVKRGADASDHHLIMAKLKKNWMETATRSQRLNGTLLTDVHNKQEYRPTLTNKFQILQEMLEEENLNTQ